MRQDENPPSAVMKADGVERTSQPQDNVAPTLTPRRTVVELSEETPEFCLFRVELSNSSTRETVQYAKLFLSQPFVS
jgi:hypothetical protein